jgi:hypothetical protein
MTTYTVNNSAGTTVASIGVATTTGTTFPIELIGQGISLYGQTKAETEYHLLENFNHSVAPTNPVSGMNWHDSSTNTFYYYSGTEWIALTSVSSSYASLYTMLATATGIDLTATGDTALYTDPNNGSTYHPTGLLLKVSGTPALTTPPLLNLKVTTSEDVMENVSVNLTSSAQHGFYIIQGSTAVVTGGATLSLEVAIAATTALTVDAYLFGFKT